MVVERWIETATGDIFKDGAKMLQTRLKNRFRVAVDRHRRRPRFSDSYLSTTMRHWLERFQDFRRDSLPSSTTFYRKTVSKDIDMEADSKLTRMLQAVAVPILGNVCHVFMHGLNRVQIYGAEKLHQLVLHRPENKPLITISNHVAAMDDPLVIASLLPPNIMLEAQNLRWTLCATDRCFRNPVTSAFFKHVKVLPVSRGDGIYQKGMDVAISKLNRGEWIHIFPEGSRSRDGGKSIGSIKRGIGRLVLDADNVPIVLPFVHVGMQDIMPVGAKLPRIGKTVTVLVGDPINFDDLLNAEENRSISRGKLYDAVCTRIGDHLRKLKAQVDRLAIEHSLQSQNYPSQVNERSARILQQVDWEYLGMETYKRTEDESRQQQDKLTEPEVESDQSQLLQEKSFQVQYVKTDFSWGEGIVSRIQGFRESSALMGLAARSLFMNPPMREKFEGSEGDDSPLKKWFRFQKFNYYDNQDPIMVRILCQDM
ncbi:hypothetical protein M9H77_27523 [Catharanthus roseus]|uniref:Uncharacterized protein n=1 Tax=Catharanthus roseus TaxID=4058 RepID=A0ACC0AEL8_CATRO|nr:hypothetical protein M9H77_27523 [Catharanthus roseus]